MTRVGPEEFFACPSCKAVGSGHPLLSYTNFSVEVRTDGFSPQGGPGQVGLPGVTRCHGCAEVFLPARAERVSRVRGAPKLVHPGEQEFLEAIEHGLFEDRAECLVLRLSAWRLGNGAPGAERAEGPPRCPEAKQNLERLFDLLDVGDADHLILKAEVARHLGRFETCAALLDDLPRGLSEPWRSTIAELARSESRGLGTVRTDWSSDLYLACKECGARSRTRAPGRGGALRCSLWIVECRECSHVAWAVDLKVDDPSPERASWPWVLLAWLAGWVAALWLGLRGSPLKFLGLSVIPLLIANAFFRLWLRDRAWPLARLPNMEQLLDCVDREDWRGPIEERWVRTQAWRRSCEEGARDPGTWTERAQRNQDRLQPLLSDGQEGVLLSAEIARRASRFDEAIELLAEHPHAEWDPRVKRARNLAREGDALSAPV